MQVFNKPRYFLGSALGDLIGHDTGARCRKNEIHIPDGVLTLSGDIITQEMIDACKRSQEYLDDMARLKELESMTPSLSEDGIALLMLKADKTGWTPAQKKIAQDCYDLAALRRKLNK